MEKRKNKRENGGEGETEGGGGQGGERTREPEVGSEVPRFDAFSILMASTDGCVNCDFPSQSAYALNPVFLVRTSATGC